MSGGEEEFLDPRTFARRLRNAPTAAEEALWQFLRGRKTTFKFRRQFPIDDKTFVDFCCTAVKVIVELDGESHEGKEDWDKARDARLAGEGFLVLRFTNEDVLARPERVVARIVNACDARPRRRY